MNSLEQKLDKLLSALLKEREIILPSHQFTPKGAETVDWVMNHQINFGVNRHDPFTMLSYTAKISDPIIFTQYAVYTDAELADEVGFGIFVNNNRVLRYHGQPDVNENPTKFELNVGLSPDLDNSALKNCYFVVQPGQTLKVTCFNESIDTARPMGVRLVGYIAKDYNKTIGLK